MCMCVCVYVTSSHLGCDHFLPFEPTSFDTQFFQFLGVYNRKIPVENWLVVLFFYLSCNCEQLLASVKNLEDENGVLKVKLDEIANTSLPLC